MTEFLHMADFVPACFDLGRDMVYEGEIFRAGEYRDRGVVASCEDLNQLASQVGQLIPAKVQHVSTAFDSALQGYGLERVEARDGGTWLWGRARFPRWIRDALGGKLAVSVGLSKQGLTPISIDEISIVNEGRIPTAALAAAFAASRVGDKEGEKMTFFQKLMAYFGRHPEALEESGLTVDDVRFELRDRTLDPEVPARLDAADARHAEMQARLETQNAALLNQRSEEFARGAVRDRKALPAEEEELRGLFSMAARADGYGMATFGLDGQLIEGDNVALLRRSIDKRRSLSLFETALSDRVSDTVEARAAAVNAGAVAAYNAKRCKGL